MSKSAPIERPRRLHHFTPLRYPGGKGKLAAYIKAVMEENCLLDGQYVEPYAGGAAIALELLFHEYVSKIHLNDISRPVHAFWKSVFQHTEEICRLIKDTPLTVDTWDKQKKVIVRQADQDDLSLGFATFYLNRTNHSGILNAGIIGGRDQTGPWKIDARYNAAELVNRIEAIARQKDRISLTRQDALKFLKTGAARWPENTLIYLDPPYYVKGRQLYYDFYHHDDHEKVANCVQSELGRQKWVVSYDNIPAIRKLYKGCRSITYDIGYSARSACKGSEVMFFGEGLSIPALTGPITPSVKNKTDTKIIKVNLKTAKRRKPDKKSRLKQKAKRAA